MVKAFRLLVNYRIKRNFKNKDLRMSDFTSREIRAIRDLSLIVDQICKILTIMDCDELVVAPVFDARDTLHDGSTKCVGEINCLLYNGFKAMDNHNIFNSDLEDLTHEAYRLSLENPIFSAAPSLKKSVDVSHARNKENLLISLVDTTHESWHPYDDTKNFLKFISPLNDFSLSTFDTKVLMMDLPFYKNVQLLDIKHIVNSGEAFWIHFVRHSKGFIRCDGNVSILDELRRHETPQISSSNVLDYMKFFDFFTLSEEGGRSFLLEGQHSEFIRHLSEYEKSRYLSNFKEPMVIKHENPQHYEVRYRSISGNMAKDTIFNVGLSGELEFVDTQYMASVAPIIC